MSKPTLEERIAALESAVEVLKARLPKGNWLESLPPPVEMSAEEWADYEAILQYIRQTGDGPPPGWKAGDPIPEPDWWDEEASESIDNPVVVESN